MKGMSTFYNLKEIETMVVYTFGNTKEVYFLISFGVIKFF